MKNLLNDAIGAVGLVCLTAGVYLKCGPGDALIVAGVVLGTAAVVAAARGAR
jgi:hypothetical protein